MKVKSIVLLLMLCIGSSAQAIPLRLDAVPQFPNFNSFTIDFNDNGNRLLELSEITSFSGFRYRPISDPFSAFYDVVNAVPMIPGISIGSGFWLFASTPNNGAVLSTGSSTFNYSISEITSVPEPATIALLVLGLVGLGWARRDNT